MLRIAARALLAEIRIETFDAVYRWSCPDCGAPRRTTRLADTIYALRHAYGWQIDTVQPHGDVLASYHLIKAGDMPGDESNGPHPRQLVGAVRAADVAPAPSVAQTANQTSIHDFDGQPIPVEAIPSPKAWECATCGTITTVLAGSLLLGGYVSQLCLSPQCRHPKTKLPQRRTFLPVRRYTPASPPAGEAARNG